MIRPASIMRFEQLWWGSFLIWLVGFGLAWQRNAYNMHRTLSDPRAATAVHLIQPVTLVLVLLVTAVLWWFATRRASGAARWAAVVVAVLAGLRILLAVMGEIAIGMPAPITTAVQVLATVLDVAAVAMLFRPDANAWFTPFVAGSEFVE